MADEKIIMNRRESLSPSFEKVVEDWKNSEKVDDLNLFYFLALLRQKLHKKVPSASIKQRAKMVERKGAGYGNQKDCDLLVYPTAVAEKELLKDFPVTSYGDLKMRAADYESEAQSAQLWFWPMQAGIGSSLERTQYLRRILTSSQMRKEVKSSRELSDGEIALGAKGTDLYWELMFEGKKAVVSLAELQILQGIQKAKKKVFRKLYFQDLVGKETEESLKRIWNSSSMVDTCQTYQELFEKEERLGKLGKIFQAQLPTISSDGELTLNRVGPGGHGLFAIAALRKAYLHHERPEDANGLVVAIGNGEDLGSMPDGKIVGWMIQEKIPLVMITTDKTKIDMKGGQLALVKDLQKGKVFVEIIEKAQAEEWGQEVLFQELGLREGDGRAYFNTNMAIFNYQELVPRITSLVEGLGEEKFLDIVAPSLIENWKEQEDRDGRRRRYLQLEGAMGSVLLNLDKYWREHFHSPLVHFLNIPPEDRSFFFSPVKTAFDFFMLFCSDRFYFDTKEFQLINRRAPYLPFIELKDAFYKELQNVLDSFRNSSILDLDELRIIGKVDLSQLKLKGKIHIINHTEKLITLKDFDSALDEEEKNGGLIMNCKIEIEGKDRVKKEYL